MSQARAGHVIVIGAGVIGLSCAIRLVEAAYDVTVIARDLPGDLSIEYSSPWAGAHFRPVPISNAAEAQEQSLVRATYREFEKIASFDPSSSVEFVPGVEYFDNPPKIYTDLKEEAGFCTWPGFRVLEQHELPGKGAGPITWGVTYRSWVLNSPVYLTWLQRHLELRGGRVIRHTLSAIPEAIFIAGEHLKNSDIEFEAVVNASGMGFGDPASFPSRGQFLVISNPCTETISYQTADGEAVVIIPRPMHGGTLIGGTKEVNNWSPHPSDASTAGILEKVSNLYPKLLTPPDQYHNGKPTLHLLRATVGRRPMRKGGLRLEMETSTFVIPGTDGFKTKTKGLKIIHCYGAGGNGYKLSWGAARRVVDLVDAYDDDED